jgi:hypothetical protein
VHLGAARTDPGAAVSFQLAEASAAAGITWWNFYFRLYPGAIRAPRIIDLLGHLLWHLRGKLLVVWDGLPARRARLVSNLSGRNGAGWRSSGCRATPRNSIRWNTSGVTGNITNCPSRFVPDFSTHAWATAVETVGTFLRQALSPAGETKTGCVFCTHGKRHGFEGENSVGSGKADRS